TPSLHDALPIYLRHGDLRRAFHWKSVRAGADGWKRNRLHAVLFRQSKRVSITTREQFVLAAMTVAPERADGVNDPLGREPVSFGDSCLTGGAPAQPRA